MLLLIILPRKLLKGMFLMQKGRIADFVVNGAMVIGHESSGWDAYLFGAS